MLLRINSNPPEAFSLLAQLQDEVEAHQAAEEQTLYAAILARSRDSARVSEGVAGHNAIGHLLSKLSGTDPDPDAWAAGLRDLAECLAGQLDHEESVLFSYARSMISEERAGALAERYELVKEAEVDLWGNAVPTAPGAPWAEAAAAE
jgi:hypothetical protein